MIQKLITIALICSLSVLPLGAGQKITGTGKITGSGTISSPYVPPPISVVELLMGILPNTDSGTVTVTFGTSTTARELILVCAENWDYNTFPSSWVTDSNSDAYTTFLSNIVFYGTTGSYVSCGYYRNAPAGVTSVTVTNSSSAGYGYVWVWHVKGLATSGGPDIYTTAFGSAGTTTWNSNGSGCGSGTSACNTTQANEFAAGYAICLYNTANCSIASSGSWVSSNSGVDGDGGEHLAGYWVLSSTQSPLEYAGTGLSGNFTGAIAMSFK